MFGRPGRTVRQSPHKYLNVDVVNFVSKGTGSIRRNRPVDQINSLKMLVVGNHCQRRCGQLCQKTGEVSLRTETVSVITTDSQQHSSSSGKGKIIFQRQNQRPERRSTCIDYIYTITKHKAMQ